MGWYHLSLVCLVVTACILQQFSPAFESLYEGRILVVPLVFLCAAVTVHAGPMLLLAFIGGFLWDAQHVITPPLEELRGNPEVYIDPNIPVDCLDRWKILGERMNIKLNIFFPLV